MISYKKKNFVTTRERFTGSIGTRFVLLETE